MCGINTSNAVDNSVNIRSMLNPFYDDTVVNIDLGVIGKQVL
jgi:hypothetical protein